MKEVSGESDTFGIALLWSASETGDGSVESGDLIELLQLPLEIEGNACKVEPEKV